MNDIAEAVPGDRTSVLGSSLKFLQWNLKALVGAQGKKKIARESAAQRRADDFLWKRLLESLNAGEELYSDIQATELQWRDDVFSGRVLCDGESDVVSKNIRGLYGKWLILCMKQESLLEGMQQRPTGPSDRADEVAKQLSRIDQLIRDCHQRLGTWKPPILSKGYAFRAPQMSEEATAKLRQLFPNHFGTLSS